MKPAALALAAAIAAQTSPPRVSPPEVPAHRGTVTTVCGVIEKYACSASEGTTLNFKGESKFRVLIPAAGHAALDKRIGERLVDRTVCVTGPIEQGGPGDQIVVRTVEDLTITPGPDRSLFAPHAHRSGCDAGVILPKLRRDRKPAYTRDAMQAGVQGAVWLEAVVEMDGKVGDIRVIKSLRHDLDEQAILALKKWRFEPATLNGQRVAVIITVELTFTLKRRS